MKSISFSTLFMLSILFVAISPAAASDGYANTTWPTLHADSRNSDFAPVQSPLLTKVEWTALDGDATLAAVTIGPEGNLYITTGKGIGYSNLHAFNEYGNHLWSSEPCDSIDDLDALAIVSSAIVDLDGAVYISDSNQFWAFYPDGNVKWVVPIPVNLVTAFFVDRHVGGITVNGQVMIFDRDNGSLDAPVMELPGGPGPGITSTPPGLWAGGLVEPAIIDYVFAGFFGREFEVCNTPAVNPVNGLIYIAAAGITQEEGTFYGIRFTPGNLEIVFQTPMGPGSATSPAISPDGSMVHACDNAGNLYAFDAYNGEIEWIFPTGKEGSLASPAIGGDGTIYSVIEGEMYAIYPSGDPKWSMNYSELALDYLQKIPPISPSIKPDPIAKVNSIISVTPNYIYAAVSMGYEIYLASYLKWFFIPKLTKLLVLDLVDGSVLATPVGLRDTCDGSVTIGPDNKLYVTHGSMAKSIAYYAINPYVPPSLKVAKPTGGISALGKALEIGTLAAQVYIHPETLNPGSEGQHITCYVELPEGYDALEIDVGTVKLDGAISALPEPDGPEGDDIDGDGIPERMIKFDRQAVIDYLGDTTGDVILTVSGNLLAGDAFEGDDTIHVQSSEPAPELKNIFAALDAFPQPSNPEVWLPYQLGKEVDVSISIYDATGHLVRTLDLGCQKEGAYICKEKAAHWDGKNEAGEKVSSGIYFYTIRAGSFSATKKIVIAR